MRVYGPFSTRTFPTDRNPTRIAVGRADTLNGGGTLTATMYTVPAGRRALLQLNLNAVVSIVLAAGQNANIGNIVTGQAVGAPTLRFFATAAVNTRDGVLTGSVTLTPGDSVTQASQLGAGAGQIFVDTSILGIEYDV